MEFSAYLRQIEETAHFLKPKLLRNTQIGIVLGTGLGGVAKEIEVHSNISYDEIPNFPVSTVESHHGKCLIGKLEGVPIVALQGRFHLYEGYSPQQITFPIRVFGQLGIKTLLISNAAGGMNPLFQKSDIMLITDHINLQGCNPLVGQHTDAWGARFPDMSEPYDATLCHQIELIALKHQIKLQQGVYIAVEGPNLETRAEYRFLRAIGGDAVGMSTVPEVIVANQMGMQVCALSVITDECFPDALEPVSIDSVLEAAFSAEPNLTLIMKELVKSLGN